MRWIVRGVLFARPAFVAAAVVAQALSLGSYALLYRRVLASLGARLPFRLAAQVTLATFLVSHLTPFGSATGTLLNVSTLETEGIAASTTGEAIGLTSLVSTIALIALFGTGLVATAGRPVSQSYLTVAGIALVLVGAVLAIALVVGAHPGIAERAGRRLGAARPLQHRSRESGPDQQAARVAGTVRADRAGIPGKLRIRHGRPAPRPALA